MFSLYYLPIDAKMFKVYCLTSYKTLLLSLYFWEYTTVSSFGEFAETDDHGCSLESFWADLLESSIKNDTSVCGEPFGIPANFYAYERL